MRYATMIGKHSASGRKVKDGVRFSALFFYKRGVSMMTDYEMLSIVIMIITLVASLLINNRDKKKQRRHPALTGGRLNISLGRGEANHCVIPSCRYCITGNTGVSTGLP